MPSIGNDIVDLNLIDVARSRQAQFYLKILAPSELDIYEALSAILAFEHYVWLCWAIKEATYKFSKRLHPQLLFSPPRTVIKTFIIETDTSNEAFCKGICSNGSSTIYFKCAYTANYVHAIAGMSENIDHIYADIFEVDIEHASAQTHSKLLNYALALYPEKDLRIHKNANNVPTLMVDGSGQPVSMAHHGRYSSFALLNQI